MANQDDVHDPADSLPASQMERIDRIADVFEEEWRRGARPAIESLLPRVPAILRGELFRALLVLDIDYRRRLGEAISREDYQRRFPDQRKVVDAVLPDDLLRSTRMQPHHTTTSGEEPGTMGADVPVRPTSGRIGRFETVATLGQGSFGTVYRALDVELQREVAIKIARQGRSAGIADLQLLEAQVAAGLDHPGVVPVYEVGRLDDDRLFIVSKLIDGTDLRTRLESVSYTPQEAVTLIASVADALHAAHQGGIIHRDIKPGNILIDASHRPYLTDFGLALRCEQTGAGAEFVGTPTYMSPEQAREEGHLVDARSDIFSLAVVLYELLTGERPFQAPDRESLLQQICGASPRPPSVVCHGVPSELDSIVLKGLARQAGDRYQTAESFAQELRAWLELGTQFQASLISHDVVTPKGLRAFDEQDAHFYLRLVPGPRNRGGIPESVAFWKTAIESREADKAFRVGVVYGPSGIGKSSLVHAGVLPLLDKRVTLCKVSATPDGTADSWLREMQRQFPALVRMPDITRAMRALRGGKVMSRESKALIVIDQFEQWLSRAADLESSEITTALRQCDGVHVQAILLVRDDYWYSLARLARILDLPLDITNCRMVELCDEQHAEKVLMEFGAGLGCFRRDSPEELGEPAFFVEAVIREFAESGPVIPAQLALIAEMFRGRPWTRQELQRCGGVRGVLAQYLDDQITGPSAHPALRPHADATFRLLRALLPPAGTAIKDRPRTMVDLQKTAGIPDRGACQEILDTLEKDLRLLTRVSPDEQAAIEPAYQLAHDNLIPVVRNWVTRQQGATLRGRVEGLLSDRSEAWRSQRTHQALPTLAEWLAIVCLTRRRTWTAPARGMMRAATRWHLPRLAIVMALLIAAGWGWRQANRSQMANELIARLRVADTQEVPSIAAALSSSLRFTLPRIRRELQRLRQRAAAQPLDAQVSRKLFNLQLALAPTDPSLVPQLVQALGVDSNQEESGRIPLRDVAAVCRSLRPHRTLVTPSLWDHIRSVRRDSTETTLRTASVLAQLDPSNSAWQDVATRVAQSLVQCEPTQLATWADLFMPVRNVLTDPLRSQFGTTDSVAEQRNLAEVYCLFAADDVARLSRACRDATPVQLSPIITSLRRHAASAVAALQGEFTAAANITRPADLGPFEALDSALVEQIDRWQGAVSATAAFVQTMPLGELDAVLEPMGRAGYRPTSVRPFRLQQSVAVAVGWRRDGGSWHVRLDLTAEELRRAAALFPDQGLELSDVSAYDAGTASDRFAATWGDTAVVGATKQLAVDLEADEYERAVTEFNTAGFFRDRLFFRQAQDGRPLFTILWRKPDTAVDEPSPVVATAAAFKNWYGGWLPSDCQLSIIDLHRQDRYLAQYYFVRHKSHADDEAIESLKLAVAAYETGRIDDCLRIVARLVAADSPDIASARLWIQALCQNGQASKSLTEIERFSKLGLQDNDLLLMRFRAALAAGDLPTARELVKALDAIPLEGDHSWSSDHLRAIVANALISESLATADSVAASMYLQRALNLIATCHDLAILTQMAKEHDFDSLRQEASFRRRLQENGLGMRYCAIWRRVDDVSSQFLIRIDATDQQTRGRQLLQEGFYPHALSLGHESDSNRLVGSSIWYRARPNLPLRLKRASGLANVAVALACLDDTDACIDVLSDEYGRQTRSYVIEHLANSGARGQRLIEWYYRNETECLRRNLLLALGKYDGESLRGPRWDRLCAELRQLASAAPNASLRAASQWCLTQWGESAPQLAPTSECNWSVNSLGQVMVAINTPGRVVMGAPGWESDFLANEVQTDRPLPPRFALSATEVTVGQFREYRSDPRVAKLYTKSGGFSYTETIAPTTDCAQTSLRFMDAVQFCQWLSEKEGIPEDQWCYPGVLDVPSVDVHAPSDFLERTGYRLPLEAEWEHACRAGSALARHYGESSDLVGTYAWYNANSDDRSHAVGRLMPNEWGFHDMLGNVSEWTQDVYRLYSQPEDQKKTLHLSGNYPRVLRGGMFSGPAAKQRSAVRFRSTLETKDRVQGLRIARTMR